MFLWNSVIRISHYTFPHLWLKSGFTVSQYIMHILHFVWAWAECVLGRQRPSVTVHQLQKCEGGELFNSLELMVSFRNKWGFCVRQKQWIPTETTFFVLLRIYIMSISFTYSFFHSPEPELPLMQTSESPQVIFAQYLGAVLELNFAVVILTA